MVKLLKHELYALFRVLIFFALAVVVFACAGRICFEIETPVTFLLVLFYIFAIVAFVVAAWALGVSRFYKTMFTGEGYLTLSLPLSPSRIIWGKLLSTVISMFFAAAVSILSLVILLAGLDGSMAVLDGFTDVFYYMGEAIGEQPVRLVELIFLLLAALPLGTLVLYATLSLGQMFTAHRKLFTAALIVIVYVVLQIIITYAMEPVIEATDAVSEHLSVWLLIVLFAGTDVGCFFLVRYILVNKVNLV